jgi:hypothetical protein
MKTDDFILKGSIKDALRASRNARKINIIATIIGICFIIIDLIYVTTKV